MSEVNTFMCMFCFEHKPYYDFPVNRKAVTGRGRFLRCKECFKMNWKYEGLKLSKAAKRSAKRHETFYNPIFVPDKKL